jgi:hypothetical protein
MEWMDHEEYQDLPVVGKHCFEDSVDAYRVDTVGRDIPGDCRN